MIPAIVSLGALLDENKRLRAELARWQQIAERLDDDMEALTANLARRDEQIAAVRVLADEYWGRATEATSFNPSWRSVGREIRAALDGCAS